MIRFIVPLLTAAFVVAPAAAQDAEGEQRPRNRFDHDILVETFGFDENTPATVPFEELFQGCPARDCIPSIDNPRYVPADEAETYLEPSSLIMAMDYNGDVRAWPIRILDFHEIVNDTIAGDPIAITWCPLCGSGVAFDRRIDGDVVEFGVAGVLHGSDLVMYDRKTETLWQQITGEGIMGPLTGHELTEVPVTITEWSRWREAHPHTKVLSTDTGFDMDYSGERRYTEYEKTDRLAFPASRRDLSVHPKAVVHGFTIDGRDLAILDTTLDEEDGELETTLGEKELTVRRDADGSVTAIDSNGNRYEAMRLFWFAWYNFHPDTEKR